VSSQVAGPQERPIDYHVTAQRIGAAAIDGIIFTVLFLFMAATIGTFGETSPNKYEIKLEGWDLALFSAICLAYYIVLEWAAQATVGKMMLGLKVAKLDGSELSFGAVLGRNLLRIVDSLPVLYIVGLIVVGVTPKRQRIGDLAAGTTVVRAGRPPETRTHYPLQ
jgi:uncharacterized RDD family membrane protein YckC